MDWGSIPDWISAVATASAFVAAAFAAVPAYRQLKILEAQDAARRAREAEADAASVAIWARTGTDDGLPLLRYINLSGKPIYELTIWVATPEQRYLIYRTVTGPQSTTREMRQATAELRAAARASGYEPNWSELLDRSQLRCASRFRDSANRWWLRDFDGRLRSAADNQGVPERLLPSEVPFPDNSIVTAPHFRPPRR